MSSSTRLNPQISIFKTKVTSPRRNAPKLIFSAHTTPLSNSASACPFQKLFQLNKENLSHVNKFGFNPERNSIDALHELKNEHVKSKVEEDLWNEFMKLMEKLKVVMERFRVLEMEKLIDRFKGDAPIADKDREEIEMMSMEIVNKFLEKPMKYLSCGEENLEVKLQDLKVLVEVFKSNICSEKKVTSKSRCLRDNIRRK